MGADGDTIAQLREIRQSKCFSNQLRTNATEIADRLLALLFPHFAAESTESAAGIELEVSKLTLKIQECLLTVGHTAVDEDIEALISELPKLHQLLLDDASAIEAGDPAANGVDEVILSYPGFLAIALHRAAHKLHVIGMPLLPRLIAEVAHTRTGIDIHPGAQIGRRFAIDHGTGVVIGETAVIGNGVRIYQGVTLGALTVEKAMASQKRHPTLGDNVVVYANATILGGNTLIGNDSLIGGNAWITESVPAFSIVGRNSEVRPRKPGGFDGVEFVI